MRNKKIAFIGAGYMSSSLIGGLIADGYEPKRIWVSDPNQPKLNDLQKRYGIHIHLENAEVVSQVDVVVFGVKPAALSIVVKEIATKLQEKSCLLISIVAGICIADIVRWLGFANPIVRCMPNTPALVNTGATALFANQHVDETQREFAELILRSVGLTIWLEQEEQLDIVTALSGSGPAYFFLLMEILEDVAHQMGLDKQAAHLLTLQTALGASQMAMQSKMDCAMLRRGVTSPGGTTERAINILEGGHARQLFANAMQAAKKRAREIAIEFSKVP